MDKDNTVIEADDFKELSKDQQEQLEEEMLDLLIFANSNQLNSASSWISDELGWNDYQL